LGAMRLCSSCGRPNGPHFMRCMSCGQWLGAASPDQGGPRDDKDAARRAIRLLEGLTPARRSLLPAEFLRSVQKQARGIDDAHGMSGQFSAVPDGFITDSHPPVTVTTGRMPAIGVGPQGQRIVPPSTGRMKAIRPSMSTSSQIPTVDPPSGDEEPIEDEWAVQSSIEISLDMPLDIDEVMDEPDTEEAPSQSLDPLAASDLEIALPEVGAAADPGAPDPLWEDSRSVRAMSALGVGEDDPTQMISVLDDFPDLLDDEQWGGPIAAGDPELEPDWAQDPLLLSLSTGRGPFGDRDARFRLLLLPSDDGLVDDDNLRLAVANATGQDLYTAGLTLKRQVPSLVASGDDPRVLNNLARDLRLAGAEVLMVERGYWLDGILPMTVVRADGIAPGPVTLQLADGRAETLPRERLGYGALASFDQPDGRTIWVLDVFLRDTPVCLRFRSDTFDFKMLGALSGGAPARRMHHLVRWLSVDPHRQLPLDEGFKHVPVTSRSTEAAAPGMEPGLVDITEYALLRDQGRRIS